MKPDEAQQAVGYLNRLCGDTFEYDPKTDHIVSPNPSTATIHRITQLSNPDIADILIKGAVNDKGVLTIDLRGRYLSKLETQLTTIYLNELCNGANFVFSPKTWEYCCSHPSNTARRRIDQLSEEGVTFDSTTNARGTLALWFSDNHFPKLQALAGQEANRRTVLETSKDIFNQALHIAGVRLEYRAGFLVADGNPSVQKNSELLRHKLSHMEQAGAVKYAKLNNLTGNVSIGFIDHAKLVTYVAAHPPQSYLSFIPPRIAPAILTATA